MCGRYSLGVSTAELEAIFEAEAAEALDLPRWNVAPTQAAPVVVAAGPGARRIEVRVWGVDRRVINVRVETVAVRAGFRDALRHRRCLVPADGFYEWAQVGGRKQPYWIHGDRDGGLLALAGLWTGGQFTILTTEADDIVRPLHDRMPVALPRAAWKAWLDPHTGSEALAGLLAHPVAGALAARPVSSLVNRPENDEARCIEPVGEPLPEQSDLFEGR